MAELPIYRTKQVPEQLMTLRQLRELGLRPADPDRVDALLALGLFDRHTAVPVAPAPLAAQRVSDELAAVEWARAILADPEAVVLDLECTDVVHGCSRLATLPAPADTAAGLRMSARYGHRVVARGARGRRDRAGSAWV